MTKFFTFKVRRCFIVSILTMSGLIVLSCGSCLLVLRSIFPNERHYSVNMHGFLSIFGQPQEVLQMTDGVRLPAGAHNVWIYESPFSPDMYTCLMFQADIKGIRKFVEAVSGRPLNEFTKENDRHGIQRYFPKTEPWAAAQIEHGRYYRRGKSRGGIAVDMDRRIVYLVPMSALSPVKPK